MIRSPGQVTILVIVASMTPGVLILQTPDVCLSLSFLIITNINFVGYSPAWTEEPGGATVHGVPKCHFHFALLSTAWRPCNYLRSLNFSFSDSKFTKLVTDVYLHPTPILPSGKSLECGCRDSGPPFTLSQYICTGIPASEMYPYESVL